MTFYRHTLHRRVLATSIGMLLFVGLCNTQQAVAVDKRPNIVVILCDDLGYGDLECYGHPHIKTPNLDQLASDGIRFTDFYSTAPVCSPSRVGLLTGRSPNRAGVYDWIPPARAASANGRDQVHMRKSEQTISQVLQLAGYDTCMSGKWHCNSRFNQADQPQPGDFGFDHWFGTQNNAAPSHENPTNYVRNGEKVGPLEGYSCQLAVDEVIGWLDGNQTGEAKAEQDKAARNPFFVYLAFHEPHEPVASPKKLVDQYLKVAKDEDEAQYFANVANVDDAVGRFMLALDDRELRDNTLVVFTSDNGPETLRRYGGAGRSWGRPKPLRGMKLHTHDAGFRVAGIMNWPGHIKSGQVSHTPVSALDFFPTFCDLAKSKVPDDLALDGTNFLPAISGEELPREKPLVWCYFNAINEARVAMRHGRWKVLARLNGGKFPRLTNVTDKDRQTISNAKLTDFEVYDIANDIGETEDMGDVESDEVGQLKDLLRAQYRELIKDSHAWKATVSK